MTSAGDRLVRTFGASGRTYRYFSLDAAAREGLVRVERLPYSIKVLLENQIGRASCRERV